MRKRERGDEPDEIARAITKHFATAFARIYKIVACIPRGRVMTYGMVAEAAGVPRGARIVGYAMRASKGRVPWQRVLGKRRKGVAHVTIKDPMGAAMQHRLLVREGVDVSPSGAVDLTRFGWMPPKKTAKKRGT